MSDKLKEVHSAQAPKSNIQAPENLQSSISNRKVGVLWCWKFGASLDWSSEFGASLVFGAWDLVFGPGPCHISNAATLRNPNRRGIQPSSTESTAKPAQLPANQAADGSPMRVQDQGVPIASNVTDATM